MFHVLRENLPLHQLSVTYWNFDNLIGKHVNIYTYICIQCDQQYYYTHYNRKYHLILYSYLNPLNQLTTHKLTQRENVCEYYFMVIVTCTIRNIIIPMMAFSSYKTQGIAFPQLYNLLKDIIKCHLFVPMECTVLDQEIGQLGVSSSTKFVKYAFS